MSDSIRPGDTAWMLTATALVLTMSPALAMFEAGLLRSKSTLSIFTQVLAGLIVLSTLWLLVGYSLTFGDSLGPIGHPLQHLLFTSLSYTSPSPHAPSIPAALFGIYHLMFAAITPLLITGAYAERIPFPVFLSFSSLFSLLVYYPIAHAVWGGGYLAQLGVQDFAGGITVHCTAGVAALVAAVMIGRRRLFDVYHGEFPPSNVPLAAVGCSLLWVGWFGFNGGSALSAEGGVAVSACVSTQIGAVSSGCVWLLLSWYYTKPSCSALMNGLLAGLAGVTPASGYISSPASLLLGSILGLSSFAGVRLLKRRLRIDDALDVCMVHGLTGMVGSLYVGLFGQKAVNTAGADGWLYGGGVRLMWVQLVGVGVAVVWSGVVSWLLLVLCRVVFGSIRVSEEEEEVGCDWASHGEVAYHQLSVLDEWERRQAQAAHFEASEREAGYGEEQRRRKQRRPRKQRPNGQGRLMHTVGEVTERREEAKEEAPPLSVNVSVGVVRPAPLRALSMQSRRGGSTGSLRSPFLSRSKSLEPFTPPPTSDAYRKQDTPTSRK